MPINIGQILQSASGQSFDDETLARNLRDWEDRVLQAIRSSDPDIDSVMRFQTQIPLQRLPVRERALFMEEYRRIIGLDYVLNSMGQSTGAGQMSLDYLERHGITGGTANKVTGIWSQLNVIRDVDTDNAYGRFPAEFGQDSLINRIYNNINLQFRPKLVQGSSGLVSDKVVGGASNYFTIGRSSIPTFDSLESMTVSRPNLAGKRVAIFDIETAGLVRGQIREIAYQVATGDASGRLVGGTSHQIALRPDQFTRGLMYHDGAPMPLERFMSSKFGLEVSHMKTGSGDDFIRNIMPFLKVLDESDYVVGHNINTFDVEQIFSGLAGTKRYKNNQQFAAYVDALHKKVKASTVDTLELVRNSENLRGLTIASELGINGKMFSISNLLMQTNLLELTGVEEIAKAMGYDSATGVFTKGLHFGDVDTLVTSSLLNRIDELKIKSDPFEGISGPMRGLVSAIRSQIGESSAITPITNITDRANILPELRGYFDSGVKVTPLDQLIYSQRKLGYGVRSTVPASELDPRAMMTRVGLFDRYRERGVKTVRETMRANYIPFAGLSMEERGLGTRLASLTGGLGAESGATRLASDALVSQFELFDPGRIEYSTYSGRASIPAQILKNAGIISDDPDNLTMLKISVTDSTIRDRNKAVNLVYNFKDQQQVDEFAAHLKNLAADEAEFGRVMGMTGDSSIAYHNFRRAVQETDFISELVDNGMTRGVSVAQLYGDQGVVGRVIDLFSEMAITEQLTDDDTFRYALPFAEIAQDEQGRGILRTAGIVLDKFLTPEDKANIGRSVTQAKALLGDEAATYGYRGVAATRETNAVANLLMNASAEGRGITAETLIEKYTTHIRPQIKKASLGALAAGAGLLLYSKKKEQDKYDVAIEQMPRQQARYSIADQLQARIDSGYNGYRQQIDPLATASIVSNLHANQIGHTNMGWDRNSNLYGGVL